MDAGSKHIVTIINDVRAWRAAYQLPSRPHSNHAWRLSGAASRVPVCRFAAVSCSRACPPHPAATAALQILNFGAIESGNFPVLSEPVHILKDVILPAWRMSQARGAGFSSPSP